jgi:hypothetical protein
VLRELRLVERQVPLTDPDPLRSRRGVYRISDRFVAFHFRHVQPHISSIEAGRGARVLSDFVRPDLPRLLAEAEGELLLESLRHEGAELVGEELADVGRHPGRAVRALARTVSGRGVAVVARGADGADVAEELAELKPLFGARLVQLVASGGGPGEPGLAVRDGRS